jgi:hypothetical protein
MADQTLAAQIEAFQALLAERSNGDHVFTCELGRLNARIMQVPVYRGQPQPDQRSVYCFIRLADGAVLKAASWKTPAKGVRAWLAEVLKAPDRVDPYGGWLYRYR